MKPNVHLSTQLHTDYSNNTEQLLFLQIYRQHFPILRFGALLAHVVNS